MTPEQLAKSYDKLASHWDSDAFNRNNGIRQHEKALQFLHNKGDAIDIGCGSSGRIIDMMLAKGLTVEGLDYSHTMLTLAKQRHPRVNFIYADICTWEFPKHYDFISAWDSVWHAPLEQHDPILRKLCNGLNPGGILIYTSGGVDEPGEGTNDFLGQPLYHAALGVSNILKIVDSCDCVCRHLEYDDPFPGKHLYLIIQKLGR